MAEAVANQGFRRPNLKEAVAAHVRDRILAGELRPGSKIDQDALAESLGVSKLPVREALLQMESEGLVRNIARRGAFVAELEPDDVRDHYYIFGLVSGLAAERAAERLTEDELDELGALVDEMDEVTDPERLETLNFEFHQLINRAGGSGRQLAILRILAASLPARFYSFTEAWPAEARRHHHEILASLRRRDAAAARYATVDHLRAGGEIAVEMLRERGFWAE
jgi:DNA-binding GntR family transcriptional regulator